MRIPIDERPSFHVASLSRQIAALRLRILEREGRLGLDDPVSAHVVGMAAPVGALTLRGLLSHASSLRDCRALLELRPAHLEAPGAQALAGVYESEAGEARIIEHEKGRLRLTWGSCAPAAGGGYLSPTGELHRFEPRGRGFVLEAPSGRTSWRRVDPARAADPLAAGVYRSDHSDQVEAEIEITHDGRHLLVGISGAPARRLSPAGTRRWAGEGVWLAPQPGGGSRFPFRVARASPIDGSSAGCRLAGGDHRGIDLARPTLGP